MSDEKLKVEHHNTLLLQAAAQGHLPRLRYLLVLKADIDHADDQGFTALHHAVFSGFEDCAQELLHLGADINAYAPGVGTPLNIAASKGQAEIIRSLIRARANVELALESQYTTQSARQLLSSCWHDVNNTCNGLPGRFAGQANGSGVVKADSTCVGRSNATMQQTRTGVPPPNEVLSIPRRPVRDKTQSPSQTTRSPASRATILPLQHGTEFDEPPSQQDVATSSRGVSYEHYVAMGAAIDQLDMAKILHIVASGADVNERYGCQKQTPLAIACKINDVDAVRKLVQQGACVYPRHLYRYSSRVTQIQIEGVKGTLPLKLGPAAAAYYASCQQDLCVLKALFAGGLLFPLLDEEESLDGILFADAKLPVALMVLELAPDLRKRRGLVQAVAEHGEVEKLQALIPTKAHLKERDGDYLLMTALLGRRGDIFEYLNTLWPMKQSNLDEKLQFQASYGYLSEVKILVEAGADTSFKGNGRTPLEEAMAWKRKEVVEYLKPLSPKPRSWWQLIFV